MKFAVSVSVAALAIASPALAQSAATDTDSAAPSGDDIVVTSTLSGDAVPVDLVGSSVTVIDDADLHARQTRFVADVLRDVPGVSVSRTGAVGGLTQVRIRGAEANQTLVFVDGIKADDPYDGSFDFAGLLADEAARIEVLRGQQSALYGSDAIGGVISYTTLTGREAPGYSARIEGGSMGTIAAGARAAGVAGDLDYALSGSYYRTDGYPEAPGGSRDIGSENAGLTGKLDWTPTKTLTLTAVGRYSHTRADTDDQLITANSPVVQGYPVITTVDTPGEYYTNRGLYALVAAKWQLFGDVWTNSLSAQIADTRRDGYYSTGRGYGDHGRRWRGSFDSTVRFGSDHVKNRFTLAAQAERDQFANTSPPDPTYPFDRSQHHIDTLGFVAQYGVTVDDRLSLGASARIDANSRFKDDATYRATASYLLPTGTRLHAAYGTGVKDPTASELFGYSDGKYIGNPALQPEVSTGWEAGIEQGFFAGHAKLGATYFKSRLTDMIESGYTADFLQTSYNASGAVRQHGIEGYANVALGAWRVDGAYTWLRAPQTATVLAGPAPADGSYQAPVPVVTQAVQRPEHSGSVDVTWAPRALPVSATATVRYVGRQRDYAFDADYDRLLADLKAYTLVDLAATVDVGKHVQLYGRIENPLDTRYQQVFTFAEPGRAAYGGVRLRL
jgi:vitamin B12 transporter